MNEEIKISDQDVPGEFIAIKMVEVRLYKERGSGLIRYENNQVILSGNTARAFHAKMNKPNKETMMQRNAYLKQIERNLSVKTVDGKIIIK